MVAPCATDVDAPQKRVDPVAKISEATDRSCDANERKSAANSEASLATPELVVA
jgi:hypothetical protein